MNLIDRLIAADYTTPKIVVVIGDSMVDHYIYGDLSNECQEECPKFLERTRTVVPGGAANAARSLTNWNVRVQFFGSPYESVKTRHMVGDRCVFRSDRDRTDLDYTPAQESVIYALDELRWEVGAILLSDYDKGMLTPEFIKRLSKECNKRSIPCVADSKQEPEVYEGCIIKGNWEYAVDRAYKCHVITCGSSPPLVYHEGIMWRYALPRVKCINHVGAGDCFAAHLTLTLAYGFSLKEAAAVAHSAGRVYVQHRHNRPPCVDEIRLDMQGCTDMVSSGVG